MAKFTYDDGMFSDLTPEEFRRVKEFAERMLKNSMKDKGSESAKGREETFKERVARQAGLEAGQMRTFAELTMEERGEVEWNWGLYCAGDYLYAVKMETPYPPSGMRLLVSRRWRMG